MFYEAELFLLRETLRKCRIQSAIADLSMPLRERKDLPLHGFLAAHLDPDKPIGQLLPPLADAVIYRITDPFGCKYIYLPLRDLGESVVLLIGPYLPVAPTARRIMELAEKNGIAPADHKNLEAFYGTIPILPDGSQVFILLEVFGEKLWGINGFTLEDIDQKNAAIQSLLPDQRSAANESDLVWNMRSLEQRYSYENELMDAVSRGQSHKADLLLGNFSTFSFEQRLSDALRNVKNYCIIMNTLLRKAAERGGVHPVYLDSASSTFAKRIEQLPRVEDAGVLMPEMFRAYCQLVRKHSMKDYSPPVQKAVACIEADLAGNLSLKTLSSALNISGSYLSTIFKKETGQTLTDYINRRRIEQAKHLLETTHLQVQTIAQHCGIMDVHYFSKVFKKLTSQTPKQYREGHNK